MLYSFTFESFDQYIQNVCDISFLYNLAVSMYWHLFSFRLFSFNFFFRFSFHSMIFILVLMFLVENESFAELIWSFKDQNYIENIVNGMSEILSYFDNSICHLWVEMISAAKQNVKLNCILFGANYELKLPNDLKFGFEYIYDWNVYSAHWQLFSFQIIPIGISCRQLNFKWKNQPQPIVHIESQLNYSFYYSYPAELGSESIADRTKY